MQLKADAVRSDLLPLTFGHSHWQDGQVRSQRKAKGVNKEDERERRGQRELKREN